MAWPRLLTTLHARVTVLFLLLLVAVGAVYYAWMAHNVFTTPYRDAEEEHWYSHVAAAQMDSLAALAAGADARILQELAMRYGEQVARFEAEMVFFAAASGQVLAASDPDSLAAAIGRIDPQLLHDMTTPQWSFATMYPEPANINAYVNRIFYVAPVAGAGGAVQAYLAGSFRPVVLSAADVTIDVRKLWLQAILVALAGSFLVGWVVMAWLTRRIHTLSTAVSEFTAGRLSHRVRDKSPDDLGRLGRDFNAMAARLEALIGQLRDKETFQRQLIANISHDLRTPMACLRGYIETLDLSQGRTATADDQHSLQIIRSNLDHMERLIDRLLQLSRLDAGQMPLQTEEFRLPELVDAVFDRCRAQALERGVALACLYNDDLPPALADPLQIGQVLQNLVENGVKFGRDGGSVTVDMQVAGSGLIAVTVRDDGPGIAPADLPHIFERFFTGDRSRSEKGQSNGLGLAIAAKIVEGHGSRLLVSSQPDHGASFRFTLTAAAALAAEASEA